MALNRGLEAVRACRLTATTGDAFETRLALPCRAWPCLASLPGPPGLTHTDSTNNHTPAVYRPRIINESHILETYTHR